MAACAVTCPHSTPPTTLWLRISLCTPRRCIHATQRCPRNSTQPKRGVAAPSARALSASPQIATIHLRHRPGCQAVAPVLIAEHTQEAAWWPTPGHTCITLLGVLATITSSQTTLHMNGDHQHHNSQGGHWGWAHRAMPPAQYSSCMCWSTHGRCVRSTRLRAAGATAGDLHTLRDKHVPCWVLVPSTSHAPPQHMQDGLRMHEPSSTSLRLHSIHATIGTLSGTSGCCARGQHRARQSAASIQHGSCGCAAGHSQGRLQHKTPP